jgi:hypothetical protein
VNDGKEACQVALKPAIDRVNTVRQYSTDKYNQGKEQVRKGVIENGQEQFVNSRVLSKDRSPYEFTHNTSKDRIRYHSNQLIILGKDRLSNKTIR